MPMLLSPARLSTSRLALLVAGLVIAVAGLTAGCGGSGEAASDDVEAGAAALDRDVVCPNAFVLQEGAEPRPPTSGPVAADEPPRLRESVSDLIGDVTVPDDLDEEGTVVIRFLVDARGRPSQFALHKPFDPRVDDQVINALRVATFDPALLDGDPVTSTVCMPVTVEP